MMRGARTPVRTLLVLSMLSLFAGQALAQGAPPIRAKFEFTAAQVLDFGVTGVEILPPVPGSYYRVAHATFVKRAGGTFTLANPGHFVQIQYENAARTPANNFLVAKVLDQAGEASATGNPASISAVTSDAGVVTSDIGGKGLQMGVNGGGSYTGSGEDCILDLYYWLLPETSVELDLVTTTPLP